MSEVVLSRTFTNQHINRPIPNLQVLLVGDALACMLPSLEKGDLPVIGEYAGTWRKLGSIKRSALVIAELLKISNLRYERSVNECIDIKTNEDIMEILA